MGRSLALNESGQHVSLWVARLDAAIRRWEAQEPERETLRRITSELVFPPLTAPPQPQSSNDNWSDGGTLEYAHVDQVNMNLMLRYVNKLKAHAGDESPEIRVPRDEGREQIAAIEDVLLQRVMGEAGAPEQNLDAIGYHCVEGNAAYWVVMPFLPSVESMIGVSTGFKEILEQARQGIGNPVPGQDNAQIARNLVEAVLKDQARLDEEEALTPAGETKESQLILAVAKQYAEYAEKIEKTGSEWAYEKGKVVVDVQTLGKYGTLFDSQACDLRGARWVARRILMSQDEARDHPSFHPKARKHLTPDPVDDRNDGVTVNAQWAVAGNTGEDTLETENGFVVVWEIWDREHFARYYINRNVNLFLQVDEAYPYVDIEGRSVIKPMGDHPGFFPLACDPVLKPVRKSPNQILGIPILSPGLPQQLEIIKLISAYLGAVKRASAGIYIHKLDPEIVKIVKLSIDGTMIEVGDEVENIKEAIQQVEWKPPSPELFMQIDKEISRFSITMNFPMAEITSQPSADTATQEQMGLVQGSLGINELLRKFEVLYGQQTAIARAFVQHYYPDETLIQVGGPSAIAVREGWRKLGIPPEIPGVRFASKAKDQNPVRVRQLMELYNVASQQIDPATGFPKFDVDHLIQEAALTLGIGKLPLFQVTPEMIQMRLAETAVAGNKSKGSAGRKPGDAPSKEGATPDTAGTQRKKPHPDGASENSAAQRTDS